MLRIKTFPVAESEAANEFMESHMPLTTDKMSGIQLNMGSIVVFYDDGVFNYKHIVQKFKSLATKEIEEIIYTEDKLARAKGMLEQTIPSGYKETLTEQEVLTLCLAEGDTKEQAKVRMEGIAMQENDIKMLVHQIMEARENIKKFEASAKKYAKEVK